MGIRKFFAYLYDTIAKTMKIGDTSGDNYTSFTSKGILRNVGEANQWDDIMGQRVAGTGSLAPTVATITGNLKLPTFVSTGTDEEFWNFEIQHNTLLSGLVDLHFHGIPKLTTDGNVKMDAEAWIFHNGTAISEVGTPYTFTRAFTTAGDNLKNCICEFTSTIDISGLEIGDLIVVRLTRDNSVSGNASGGIGSYQMGIHRQVDGFGSDERFLKNV